MENETLTSVLGQLSFAEERVSTDWPAINVPAENLVETMQVLRDEYGYNLLSDATAIDWGQDASPRFTGIYHLYSMQGHTFFRVATDCLDDENPTLPSLVSLWDGANWHEREAYDMFGIKYDGHPDMRRILMWDDYPYFPLRKEFPLAGIETDLPAADVAETTQETVKPAPMMGGPFFSPQTGAMSEREPRAADQSWTETKVRPVSKEDA